MYSTLRCLESTPRPPVSFLTTPSFHDRRRARSILGSENSTPQFLAWRDSSINLATCSRAFEGMQPRYRQTPPGFASGSISVTFIPRSAARKLQRSHPARRPPLQCSSLKFQSFKKRHQPQRTRRFTKEQRRFPSCTFVPSVVDSFQGFRLSSILAPKQEGCSKLPRSSAGIARHRRHQSDDDRRKATAATPAAARTFRSSRSGSMLERDNPRIATSG